MTQTVRSLFFTVILLPTMCVEAQTATQVPSTVTTDVGEFNSTCSVSNLIMGLMPYTKASDPFPYETTSSFTSTGIGYISSFGASAGTLTFTYPGPVAIGAIMCWNAYFTIEPDHSIATAQLRFYDAGSVLLGTVGVNLPICNLGVNTGDSISLGTTFTGVSSVEMQVFTLWGGNEISLRRIAFTGPVFAQGMTDEEALLAPAFPNPATDESVLPVRDGSRVIVLDELGRCVPVEVALEPERIVVRWESIANGRYTARITTAKGELNVPLVVQR